MIGPLISAGASLLGGAMNRAQSEDINARSMHQAELNRKTQEEFAKKGIRWRVADAKAAGIHPLYALGAQTTSFAPVSAGQVADTSLGSGVASAGQDLSRAINATRTGPERVEAVDQTIRDLSVRNMALRNDLLAAQIAKINQAGGNPPGPTLGDDGSGTRNMTIFESAPEFKTPKKEAQAQKVEDEYGEFAGDVSGGIRAFRDALRAHGVPLGRTPAEYSALLGNWLLSDAAKTRVSVQAGSPLDLFLRSLPRHGGR